MPRGHGDLSKAAFMTQGEIDKSVVISDPSQPDSPIIYVSEEFEVQTGYPPEDVNRHAIRALTHFRCSLPDITLRRGAEP